MFNTGFSQKTPDIWHNFYEKIKETKYINRNLQINEFENNVNLDKIFTNELEELNKKQIFTAEENNGRCVDMNNHYLKYLSLKKVITV